MRVANSSSSGLYNTRSDDSRESWEDEMEIL